MTMINLISKVELAILRRMPFSINDIYVPALHQSVKMPNRISNMFHEIFILKIYEPIAPLRPKPVIVDLGMNLGLFMIYINSVVSGGEVFGFEANPTLFPYLQSNVSRIAKKNGNSFKLFNLAVTNYSGYIDFVLDHENPASPASTAFLDTSTFSDAANYRPVRVPCDRLEHLVSSPIDFLKCDIEGAEYDVLNSDLLNPGRVRQAVVEFHDLRGKFDAFKGIIERSFVCGYEIYSASGKSLPDWRAIEQTVGVSRNKGKTSEVLKFCAGHSSN